MLLAVHTDKEFTYWLQRHAEEGWKLKENKGNTFVFTQNPYEGRRICSYTVNSDALGVSAEDAFYELQDDLRKSGWRLLTMGMPESLTDRTRHAFLVETPREDLPHPELPLSDPEGQLKLLRGALNKAVSTLALCLLYAAVLIYFITFRPGALLTDIPGKVFLIGTAIILVPCLYFSVNAASLYAKAVRDPAFDTSTKDFQCLDKAVILSFIMLVILAAYLILDFLL